MSAEEFKALGNKAFSAGQFQEAIEQFTKAIELSPTNHVLYSNRSASYASVNNWEKALEDGIKTVEIKPDWVKGYSRKGAAYYGLGRYAEARETYVKGLEYDPANQLLKKGLQDAENAGAEDKEGRDPFGRMADVFKGDVLAKIAAHPKLSSFLIESDYVYKIQQIQQNPGKLGEYAQDMRIMQTMFMLMGIDAQVTDKAPESYKTSQEQAQPNPEPTPKPNPIQEKTEEELKEESDKAQAEQEKLHGNTAYKKRDFETALTHYNKAISLSPYNVIYYNNKAALHFEKGEYDECIKVGQEAIEINYEHRNDYKVIAKTYSRIASAYLKKDMLDEAIKYFNKSLTEHRSADTLNKLRDTERLKKKKEEEAYLDSGKADESREKGNKYFKEQKYVEAVKEYSESIKRSPTDPRTYSNRAACYTKLLAIPDAIKDCEKCLELDPKFVKAYLRRANIEFIKKNYAEAMDFCYEAMDIDTEGKNKAEIDAQLYNCHSAISKANQGLSPKEAMERSKNDPTVQQILADPGMQMILQQMQTDPSAARVHLKNKLVAKNLRKLWAAGIVHMG